MAWNDPGGNGSKDPWGNRNSDSGPPDLDEVVRKMQDKLGGIFGSGGGRGGRGAVPGGGSPLVWVGLAVGLAAFILWEIAHIIQPAERGVVLRFGQYVDTLEPGLNIRLPRPIEYVEVVDIDQIRSVSHKALMLTRDENIVDVELAVQYRIKDVKDYQFNVDGPDATLRLATESAIREVIGKNDMDFVLTEGRAETGIMVKDLLQAMLDQYRAGLQVTSVNMQPAKPPEPVKSAFDEAIKAREDEQRLINEAQAYRNEVLPKARGRAARMREEAAAYKDRVVAEAEGDASRFVQLLGAYQRAPGVTRERLYLETVEAVLGNTTKVLLDAKSGSNLLLLPLDKLFPQLDGTQPRVDSRMQAMEPRPRTSGEIDLGERDRDRLARERTR